MSNPIFHVRPLDSGKGWAIDEYDGRGAWQHSVPIGPNGAPMDKIQAKRDKYHTQSQDLEKKLAAIATLVSIYDNQDEPEGQVSERRALTAIGETIGQQCSICRSRHGSEVRHHAE
jgi:hypothetical protein